MRWKALYILLALVVFFAACGGMLLNRLIDWSLERSLETVIGAKVEVERVALSLRRLTLDIERLRITNPRNTRLNLVAADDIRCRLAATPLYSGRFVIEEAVIAELMINTPRQTDGRLTRKPLPGPLGQAQIKLNNDIAAMPILDPNVLNVRFDLNGVLPTYDFVVGRKAEALRAEVERTDSGWDDKKAALSTAAGRAEEIGGRLRTILAAKPRSVLELQGQLAEVQRLRVELDALIGEAQKMGGDWRRDYEDLSRSVDDLDQAAAADYDNLMQLARLPDLASFSVAEALFGRALLNESAMLIDLMDQFGLGAPPAGTATKTKPKRGGVDVTFSGRRTYPRLLIERFTITGRGTGETGLAGFRVRGEANGITNEPAVYGRPLTAVFTAAGPGEAALELRGSIKHHTPVYQDEFSLNLTGLPLSTIQLPDDGNYLPRRVLAGRAEIQAAARIESGSFALDLTFTGRDIVGDYGESPPAADFLSRLVRESLARIDLLRIEYHLQTGQNGLRMRVASNLDEIIAVKLQTLLGAEIERVGGEIRRTVDAELQQQRTAIDALISSSRTALAAEQKEAEAALSKQSQLADQVKTQIDLEIKKLTDSLPKLPF